MKGEFLHIERRSWLIEGGKGSSRRERRFEGDSFSIRLEKVKKGRHKGIKIVILTERKLKKKQNSKPSKRKRLVAPPSPPSLLPNPRADPVPVLRVKRYEMCDESFGHQRFRFQNVGREMERLPRTCARGTGERRDATRKKRRVLSEHGGRDARERWLGLLESSLFA